jgi:hypothetical protein
MAIWVNRTRPRKHLERFLRGANRSVVLTERLEDAKKRLREYERTLSRLAVTVTTATKLRSSRACFLMERCGANCPSGNTPPPGFLFTAPGSHEVRVASSGLRDFAVSIDLRPGELRKLAGALAPCHLSDETGCFSYTDPTTEQMSRRLFTSAGGFGQRLVVVQW